LGGIKVDEARFPTGLKEAEIAQAAGKRANKIMIIAIIMRMIMLTRLLREALGDFWSTVTELILICLLPHIGVAELE
jgi:hypothetical protein